VVDTEQLLRLIGHSSTEENVKIFLNKCKVFDRPQSIAELSAAGYLEDDEEADVEYETKKASEESMIVQSERYGFCLMFSTRQDYCLTFREAVPENAEFILCEIALFARGVQIYQQFSGVLSGFLTFASTRASYEYLALGTPISRRVIQDCSVDLFLIDYRVVNFGFDVSNGTLLHVHISEQNYFDRIMLGELRLSNAEEPRISFNESRLCLGASVFSVQARRLVTLLGVDEEELDVGVCPEEIAGGAKSLGVILYTQRVLQSAAGAHHHGNEERIVSITFKRRGDLGSLGFLGEIPFGFVFGDSPPTILEKAGTPPIMEHRSYELLSYFWRTENRDLVQAICSLIDWQLCRISIHAECIAENVVASMKVGPPA
jgi:hypothetical protein